MKIFLASEWFGNYLAEFVELVGLGSKVAFTVDAADKKGEERRLSYAETVSEKLSELGLVPVEIDLRKENKQSLLEILNTCKAVLVAGGNTFVLRDMMRQSGFDEVVPKLVFQNKIIYAGWSAGAIIAAPTLDGLHFMDHPEEADVQIWKGLDLVKYSIIPHWQSKQYPDYARIGFECQDYLKRKSLAFKTLTDDQAILVRDGDEEFLS